MSSPGCSRLIERLAGVNNDLELAEYLHRAGRGGPGARVRLRALGGHVRISIATSRANLEQALERIAGV